MMQTSESRLNDMIDKLRKNNFRLTPQRLEILKVLARESGHPTVEQVHDKVRLKFQKVSLATVYRNIIKLKELGEVLELGFPDGSNRYDGRRPYSHPHLICIECKKIVDPNWPEYENLKKQISAHTGFEILTHRLDFFGRCPECRNK